MRHYFDFRSWVVNQLRSMQADGEATRLVVTQIPARFNRLERIIMATASELVAAFNSATDEVASDLQDLRDRLQEAIADKDQAVQDAVNGVLTEFDAPLQRLQELGADPADPVPGENVPVDEPVDEQGNPVS